MNLLTGEPFDPSATIENYFKRAWRSETADGFYDLLHENGYAVNIYGNIRYISGNPDLLLDKVDNVGVINTHQIVDNKKFMVAMAKFSAIRYMPFFFKQFVWISTTRLQGLVSYEKNGNPIKDDYEYAKQLLSSGLSLNDNQGVFYFVHLLGAHGPSHMDENMNYEKDEVPVEKHFLGSIKIVIEFLHQMKELGIYNEATILITSDHGNRMRPSSLFMIKQSGEIHEKLQLSNAPTMNSDLIATIASLLTDNHSMYGTSVFDIQNDTQRKREWYTWDNNDSTPKVGTYNTMRKYTYMLDVVNMPHDFLNTNRYEIIPITYPFYGGN